MPTAIADYAALKTQVAAWLNRTDLTSQIPVFVGMAESMIRKPPEAGGVRMRAQETVTTGTLTGETLAQPATLVETRRLSIDGLKLDYVTPADYSVLKDRTVSGGKFTVIGDDFYILGGASGDAYELVYTAAFTALSADGDTNDLLTSSPEVYLWAVCHMAAVYQRDVVGAEAYLGMYRQAVANLHTAEKMAQTSTPLTVRAERRE